LRRRGRHRRGARLGGADLGIVLPRIGDQRLELERIAEELSSGGIDRFLFRAPCRRRGERRERNYHDESNATHRISSCRNAVRAPPSARTFAVVEIPRALL
jgi:hypothetical protein